MFCGFKKNAGYYVGISDWSSDVCSSDLSRRAPGATYSIELDLSAADVMSRRDSADTGTVFYKITDLGEKELAAEKEREIARRRPHHDLASRLAFWLQESGRITWENIELLVPVETGGRQAVRPDVFSMEIGRAHV